MKLDKLFTYALPLTIAVSPTVMKTEANNFTNQVVKTIETPDAENAVEQTYELAKAIIIDNVGKHNHTVGNLETLTNPENEKYYRFFVSQNDTARFVVFLSPKQGNVEIKAYNLNTGKKHISEAEILSLNNVRINALDQFFYDQEEQILENITEKELKSLSTDRTKPLTEAINHYHHQYGEGVKMNVKSFLDSDGNTQYSLIVNGKEDGVIVYFYQDGRQIELNTRTGKETVF